MLILQRFNKLVHPFGRCFFHLLRDVTVHVHGGCDSCVTHSLLYFLEAISVLESIQSKRVAEVVEADTVKTDAVYNLFKCLIDCASC